MKEQLDSDTVALCIKVRPKDIVILQAIVEGYDGLAVLRTLDEELGIISIIAVNDSVCEVESFLDGISAQFEWSSFNYSGDILDSLNYRH